MLPELCLDGKVTVTFARVRRWDGVGNEVGVSFGVVLAPRGRHAEAARAPIRKLFLTRCEIFCARHGVFR